MKEQQIRDELLCNLHEKDLQMQKMMQRQQAVSSYSWSSHLALQHVTV